jgi:hypothetical protein
LSDLQAHEPSIRARLGSAAYFEPQYPHTKRQVKPKEREMCGRVVREEQVI